MSDPYQAAPDIHVIPTDFLIPGLGVIPINAFVIKAEEPVLVDTGIAVEGESFIRKLRSIIDPAEIKWIWITHDDLDHIGSVQRILELSPGARIVTHALCALRIAATWHLPLTRMMAIRSQEYLDVGGHELRAMLPPLFDNPTTTGSYDVTSGTLFSVDAFGAILPHPRISLSDLSETELAQGMIG